MKNLKKKLKEKFSNSFNDFEVNEISTNLISLCLILLDIAMKGN